MNEDKHMTSSSDTVTRTLQQSANQVRKRADRGLGSATNAMDSTTVAWLFQVASGKITLPN